MKGMINIKEAMIEHMVAMARGGGIPEDQIAKAKKECEDTNTDTALKDLIIAKVKELYPGLIPND